MFEDVQVPPDQQQGDDNPATPQPLDPTRRRPKMIPTLSEKAAMTASWRWQKADEYPDDERNVNCALSLNRLAQNLSKLTQEGHPLIAEIEELDDCTGRSERFIEIYIEFLQEIDREMFAQYGFHGEEDGDPTAFLSAYKIALQQVIKETEERENRYANRRR